MNALFFFIFQQINKSKRHKMTPENRELGKIFVAILVVGIILLLVPNFFLYVNSESKLKVAVLRKSFLSHKMYQDGENNKHKTTDKVRVNVDSNRTYNLE